MSYIRDYRRRPYVRTTNWGITLFALGLILSLFGIPGISYLSLLGCLIGLSGATTHQLDSNRRIAALKAKLHRLHHD